VGGARARLNRAKCALGKVTTVHSTTKKRRIVSQSRRPGSDLAPGSKINVKVGK
jgi:beta-lactam-binding protein with PASTA domain